MINTGMNMVKPSSQTQLPATPTQKPIHRSGVKQRQMKQERELKQLKSIQLLQQQENNDLNNTNIEIPDIRGTDRQLTGLQPSSGAQSPSLNAGSMLKEAGSILASNRERTEPQINEGHEDIAEEEEDKQTDEAALNQNKDYRVNIISQPLVQENLGTQPQNNLGLNALSQMEKDDSSLAPTGVQEKPKQRKGNKKSKTKGLNASDKQSYCRKAHAQTKPTSINKIKQHYLFAINNNTKYLIVYPIKDKSSNELFKCLKQLVKLQHVSNIRSDGEAALGSNQIKDYLKQNGITYYFNSSKFINKKHVVDSVVLTIRNAFENDDQLMANNKQMQQVIDDYNNIKHSAFKNKFTPQQVNESGDLEGKIIEQIEKPILEKKPRKKYVKKVKINVNPIVEPSMEPAAGGGRANLMVPVVEQLTEPTTEPTTEPLMQAPIGRPATPWQGRPRKYYTEEEARDMARLQRKQFKQRLREKQKPLLHLALITSASRPLGPRIMLFLAWSVKVLV
ncbi:MAG: hypothetical protein EZS28_007893 [Streblomastix strix]|uniref:Integrase catalytic domain-containing protein n=1 Tax=Streblomastix strix TaxID=222440 RepID=A0A5J4WNQ4_9EUKA|nr:MAG: hypothetical protein EZS28_007890 [Streblomastix strix]KAA6396583.1 MAG: hypothetical protein EZS28_007893 [Streblomastix strix]